MGILYSTSYLKQYLVHLLNYSTESDENSDGIIDVLVKYGYNTLPSNVILFYYIKILASTKICNYSQLRLINRTRYQIEWFTEALPKDYDYLFNYVIMDINKIDQLKQFIDLINRSDNHLVLVKCIIQSNGMSCFVDSLIYTIISHLIFHNCNDNHIALINNVVLELKQESQQEDLLLFVQLFFQSNHRTIILNNIQKDTSFEMLLYTYKLILVLIINNNNKIKQDMWSLASNQLNQLLDKEDIYLFKLETCTIHKLDPLHYRILLMGLLGFVYYGSILNKINNVSSNRIFSLLEHNWKALDIILKRKHIVMQIYMNMFLDSRNSITSDDLIQNQPSLKQLINECINDYKQYEDKYKIHNYVLLQRNKNNIRTMLYEVELPSEYDPNRYPLMHYFQLTKYPNRTLIEQLMKSSLYQKNYPLLYAYLTNKDIENLQLINIINSLSNKLIDQSSYCLSYEESSMNFSVQEKIEYQRLFDAVKSILPSLKQKYNVNSTQKRQWILNKQTNTLTEAVYKYLITKHNQILKEMYKAKGIQYNHDNTIPIQDAMFNEIFAMDFTTKNHDTYKSFDDVMWYSSNRSCFDSNGSINYMNYQHIDYDLDKIEHIMTDMFLTGKKLLNNDLTYAIYSDEEYLDEKTSLIYLFIKQFKAKPIDHKLKQKIRKKAANELQVDIQNNIYKKFKLFLYKIMNESHIDPNSSISNGFALLKSEEKLQREIENIISEYQIINLISIYDYLELLFYPKYRYILSVAFKRKIEVEDEKRITMIINSLEHVLKEELLLIILKYITRVLINRNSNDNIIDLELNLFTELKQRRDLWFYNDNKESIEKILNKCENELYFICVGQSDTFYLLTTSEKYKLIKTVY